MLASTPFISERNNDGSVIVEQRYIKGHQYETLVIKVNNHLYRVADERVSAVEPDTDGHRYYYNDGEDSYEHDFEMSPNKRWLFVTRKCLHTVNVGYLFHYNGKQFMRVCPQGLRFDEAALRYFGKTLHFPIPTLDNGARVIGFIRWAHNSKGFVFIFDEGIDWARQTDEKEITGYYGFRSKQFKLLKIAK